MPEAHQVRPQVGPSTAEGLLAFQQELDDIRARVLSHLGEEDARYVKTLLWLSRGLVVLGRGLLVLGAWFWPTWWLGVLALTVSHLIETMELGHNLMHGQFNWMNDRRFSGKDFRWGFACEPEDWRHFHNLTHHHYANVLGRDRDYGSLRLSAEKPWRPAHLAQPFMALVSAVSFEWGVAVHNLQLERRKADPEGFARRHGALWPRTRARMAFIARREYVWWPLVGAAAGAALAWATAGQVSGHAMWAAWTGAWQGGTAVLLGNVMASVFRSVWGFFIIACGHFTAEAHMFDEADLAGETKAQWYLRQVLSAANFRGGTWLQVLSGHASHQIEHHIYPDLPSNRLAQIAPWVEEVCKRHGVPYNTGSLGWQVWTVVLRIVRHSFPGGWDTLTRLPQPHSNPQDVTASPREIPLERAA
jgi:NADPH-dependent stearoyl-CoA 9-desaturase